MRARVRGNDVRGQRPEELRRSIGYVIQDGGLFPHMSVAANVATVPRLLGWDRERTRKRVAAVLELVGLPEAQFGRRLPAELSGGQRQRVGVARALAADPDLLLMDEPFGALDPGTRESIYDEFVQLNARLHKTVVIVTHDIIEAGRLADEIVLLDHGRIAQCGSLRDLLLHPADERVLRFLGGRGPDLALSVLRLRQIVAALPADGGAPGLRLAPDLPLGRARWRSAERRTGRPWRSMAAATRPRCCTSASWPSWKRSPPPMRRWGRSMLAFVFFDNLASAWELSHDSFAAQLGVFISLTLRALGLALLIGIPIGLALTRLPRLAGPVTGLLAIVQTVPALVFLAMLLTAGMGIRQTPALIAAVAYSIFPIVVNTYVGVTQVAPPVRDAARGMGMTVGQILWHVELPLAFPVLLVGVRTAAVYASSMIVLGSLVGAGGLGDYIYNGMNRGNSGLIWLGTLPVLALTLLLFWGLGSLARFAKRNSGAGLVVGGTVIVLLSAYAAYGAIDSRFFRPCAQVVVGAKDFIEGQILAQVVKQSVESHTDLRVEIVSNLGTTIILNALKNGEIDLYPEYTGNLLTSKEALDLPVPADRSRITDMVLRGHARSATDWCCWSRSGWTTPMPRA